MQNLEDHVVELSKDHVMTHSESTHIVVYGIDPGSSKSWATYRALIAHESLEITHLMRKEYPISSALMICT